MNLKRTTLIYKKHKGLIKTDFNSLWSRHQNPNTEQCNNHSILHSNICIYDKKQQMVPITRRKSVYWGRTKYDKDNRISRKTSLQIDYKYGQRFKGECQHNRRKIKDIRKQNGTYRELKSGKKIYWIRLIHVESSRRINDRSWRQNRKI